MEYSYALLMRGFTHTSEMKKIVAGFLIKEIFDRFKLKTLSLLNPDRLVWLYCASDTAIVDVLNALNVFDVNIHSSIQFPHCRIDEDN